MLAFRPQHRPSSLHELDAKLTALQADLGAALSRATSAESVAQAALSEARATNAAAAEISAGVRELAQTLRGEIAALVAQTTARLDAIIGVPQPGGEYEQNGKEAGGQGAAESTGEAVGAAEQGQEVTL